MAPVSFAALIWTLFSSASAYRIYQQSDSFPFPDDKVNASVTVNFESYDVTKPYSNSSEPTTPWQARLKVRSNVFPEEFLENGNRDEQLAINQISLTYDVDDTGNVEEPDESWGYCVGIQMLFNVTTNMTESIDPTCAGILDVKCIEWLQEFADAGGPCSSSPRHIHLIHEELSKSACDGKFFPAPSFPRPEVPPWSYMKNSTLDEMYQSYKALPYAFQKENLEPYDDIASRTFVLVASWGERNESNSTQADPETALNGTVMCLRVNSTADGSRALEEIGVDGAAVLGSQAIFTIALAVVSATLLAFVF